MALSFRTLAASASVALLASAPALAQESRPATMQMLGNATVSAAPDQALLTSGVVTQAKTAAEALRQNTSAMSALIDVLKAAGIASADIQTSGFSVQPQYAYSNKLDANGYQLPPTLIGYQVSNNVTFRIRQLDKLGGLIDAVVSVGSNTIGGINFGVTDPTELLNQSRRKAMSDAIGKASLYAEAANVCLARILSITENGGYQPEPKMLRAMALETASDAVPVEAGEVGYSINVSVEWELSQAPCQH